MFEAGWRNRTNKWPTTGSNSTFSKFCSFGFDYINVFFLNYDTSVSTSTPLIQTMATNVKAINQGKSTNFSRLKNVRLWLLLWLLHPVKGFRFQLQFLHSSNRTILMTPTPGFDSAYWFEAIAVVLFIYI